MIHKNSCSPEGVTRPWKEGRPFGATVDSLTRRQGLRCAPPLAILGRPFGATTGRICDALFPWRLNRPEEDGVSAASGLDLLLLLRLPVAHVEVVRDDARSLLEALLEDGPQAEVYLGQQIQRDDVDVLEILRGHLEDVTLLEGQRLL